MLLVDDTIQLLLEQQLCNCQIGFCYQSKLKALFSIPCIVKVIWGRVLVGLKTCTINSLPGPSVLPRPSPLLDPVFDCLQYTNMDRIGIGNAWEISSCVVMSGRQWVETRVIIAFHVSR